MIELTIVKYTPDPLAFRKGFATGFVIAAALCSILYRILL
jgi:hypothetical protein